MKEADERTTRGKRRRRLVAVAIVAAIIAVLPHLVAKTALRDVVLNRLAARSGFRVTTQGASFGWFSPVRVSGVVAEKEMAGIELQIADVQLQKPWLSTWRGLPELGRVVIDKPELTFQLPSETATQPKMPPPRPVTGSFEVR